MLLIVFISMTIFSKAQDEIEDMCNKGDRQSPIEIIDTFEAKYYKLELRFKDDILVGKQTDSDNTPKYLYEYTDDTSRQVPEFRMLGHDPHGLMVGYRPMKFQLISPAEHVIHDESYDLELVIWGDLLVIYKNPNIKGALSFFFKVISEEDALNYNWTQTNVFNINEDNTELSLNMINLAALLKNQHKYITYRGSETWGYCSEDVDRFLIPLALPITQETLDKIVQEKEISQPNQIQEIRKRRIVQGTLIVDDETSANYNPIYRFLSLTFIGFLFFLIFALFFKEQREKQRLERAKKFKTNN